LKALFYGAFFVLRGKWGTDTSEIQELKHVPKWADLSWSVLPLLPSEGATGSLSCRKPDVSALASTSGDLQVLNLPEPSGMPG
jgi:hypothetical protein